MPVELGFWSGLQGACHLNVQQGYLHSSVHRLCHRLAAGNVCNQTPLTLMTRGIPSAASYPTHSSAHAASQLTQILLGMEDSDAEWPPGTGIALMSGCAHQSMSHPASPPQSSLSLWGRSLAAAGSVSDTCSCPPCMPLLDISALPSAMSCLHICTSTARTSLFLLLRHAVQSRVQGRWQRYISPYSHALLNVCGSNPIA